MMHARHQQFRNREEAGRQLAEKLELFANDHPIVLALPRGGVPVGYEIARTLHAPLDVWIVRKIGVPWHPELGVGAVAEGGQVYLSPEVLAHVKLSPEDLDDLTEQERREVEERVKTFRRDRSLPDIRDRTVILVDDGIATGGTVHAAVRSIRAHGPSQIVLAVPVAARDTLARLEPEVDRVVCLVTPYDLYAIGLWYEEFDQVPDAEVLRLLERARDELSEAEHVA